MNFYKPLLLPSNNVPYDSIVSIKEPDVSFLLQLKTSFLDSSEIEMIYALIKKYTDIVDPKKLYYKDAQYLFYYFFTIINSSDEIKIPSVCFKCDHDVDLLVNLSDFDTVFAKKEHFEIKKIKINGFEFYFRNRLFSDNIFTGMINLENKNNQLKNIINFIKPQCMKVIYNDEEFSGEYIEDALIEIGYQNSLNVFEELRSEPWGIDSYFFYNCSKCGEKNKTYLSDPFRSSFYFSKEKSGGNLELLHSLLEISSFKIISFDDMLNIPLSLWESTVSHVNKIIKKKYSTKDSVGYLDQFQEELE
jgi:hypothetical protein